MRHMVEVGDVLLDGVAGDADGGAAAVQAGPHGGCCDGGCQTEGARPHLCCCHLRCLCPCVCLSSRPRGGSHVSVALQMHQVLEAVVEADAAVSFEDMVRLTHQSGQQVDPLVRFAPPCAGVTGHIKLTRCHYVVTS